MSPAVQVPSATVSGDPEVPQVDFRCFMMQVGSAAALLLPAVGYQVPDSVWCN